MESTHTSTMKEYYGLRLRRPSYRGKFLDVDLIIRQVTQITVFVVTTNVEEVSIIWSLVARAFWRDGIDSYAVGAIRRGTICLSQSQATRP